MNLGSKLKSSPLGVATLFVALLGFSGCNPVSKWVAQRGAFEVFSEAFSAIELQVREGDFSDNVEAELYSNTGAITVGVVSVEPAGGPVGTPHVIAVDVLDAYVDQVVQVDVVLHSEARGHELIVLTQDTASTGHWQIRVISNGLVNEERVDYLDVILYHDPKN